MAQPTIYDFNAGFVPAAQTDKFNVADNSVRLNLRRNVVKKAPSQTVIAFEFFDGNGDAIEDPSGLAGSLTLKYKTSPESPLIEAENSPFDLSVSVESLNYLGTVISELDFSWSGVSGATQLRFTVYQGN